MILPTDVYKRQALEKPLLVAYLGPEASNTHAAAIKKFGASVDYHSMGTIEDIFVAVEKGEADNAVIPIENSTEGSVREALDSFVESDLKIVGQIYLEIAHALIGRSPLERIERVFSKDQALAQPRQLVAQHARLGAKDRGEKHHPLAGTPLKDAVHVVVQRAPDHALSLIHI